MQTLTVLSPEQLQKIANHKLRIDIEDNYFSGEVEIEEAGFFITADICVRGKVTSDGDGYNHPYSEDFNITEFTAKITSVAECGEDLELPAEQIKAIEAGLIANREDHYYSW